MPWAMSIPKDLGLGISRIWSPGTIVLKHYPAEPVFCSTTAQAGAGNQCYL